MPDSVQQPSAPQPNTKSGLRYWVNIAFGLLVLIGIVVGGFFLMEYFYNRSKDKNTVHFIMYSKGRTDFQQDLVITYNESPIGRIDSALANIEAVQLFVRKDEDLSQTWYVLTMLANGKYDVAEIDSTFRIICGTDGGISLYLSNSEGDKTAPLFTISDTYRGLLKGNRSDVRLNGNPLNGDTALLRAGDDISFRIENKGYTLRWNPRDLYTRLYCTIDSTQLGGATLLKFGASPLLTHSASINISNTFGLTKTTAKFTPTFSPDMVQHYFAGALTEVQSAGSFDMGDLQNALAYLANRKTMNQTPSSRLERIISSVDSLGMNTAALTKNVNAVTIPAVNQTIESVKNTTLPELNASLKRLVDSLSLQVSTIEKDFNALTKSTEGTIGGIGGDVKSAMKSVQKNLDAVSEQIRRLREEVNATNKSIKAITDDPVKKIIK